MDEKMPQDIKMSKKEMYNDVNKDLNAIKRRHDMLRTRQTDVNTRFELIRAKFIQSLFDILKQAGVDPTNLDSINQFLQKLEQTDPDLAELFSMAFDSLAGGDESVPGFPSESSGPMSSDEMLAKYSNLRQSLPQEGMPALPPEEGMQALLPEEQMPI